MRRVRVIFSLALSRWRAHLRVLSDFKFLLSYPVILYMFHVAFGGFLFKTDTTELRLKAFALGDTCPHLPCWSTENTMELISHTCYLHPVSLGDTKDAGSEGSESMDRSGVRAPPRSPSGTDTCMRRQGCESGRRVRHDETLPGISCRGQLSPP